MTCFQLPNWLRTVANSFISHPWLVFLKLRLIPCIFYPILGLMTWSSQSVIIKQPVALLTHPVYLPHIHIVWFLLPPSLPSFHSCPCGLWLAQNETNFISKTKAKNWCTYEQSYLNLNSCLLCTSVNFFSSSVSLCIRIPLLNNLVIIILLCGIDVFTSIFMWIVWGLFCS